MDDRRQLYRSMVRELSSRSWRKLSAWRQADLPNAPSESFADEDVPHRRGRLGR